MATPVVQNSIQTGLDLLINYWKDKPVAQGLLKSKLREIQELEDVTFQLLNERNVTDAIGEQLNVIGYIVGEKREGRGDEEYRQAILTRISLNRADGTPPFILDTLNTLTGTSSPNIFEHFPASYHGYVDRKANHSVARILQSISPAGVESRLIFDDEGNSFSGAYSIPSTSPLEIESNTLFEIDSGFYLSLDDVQYIEAYEGKSTLDYSQDLQSTNPFSHTIRGDILFATKDLLEIESNTLFEIDSGFYLEFRDVEE
jgi:hypothetical protein